ncbi:MAG: hypothetical protein VX589_01110 [Myxococcota bacterium]|nr:hypothetical protein [Myxococcota bacterium]
MITSFLIIVFWGAPPIQALIDADRWDEASAQLSTVSPSARPRYEGLIAQGRGQSAKAVQAFERALVTTPNVPQLHLHAAHAYLQLQRFEDVLRHARAASTLRESAIAQPLLEARALAGLKRDGEAYDVLKIACELFKDEMRPWLELAVVAHRKGVTGEVRRAARHIVANTLDRAALLPLFQLLHGDADALPILEEIIARHPDDAELRAMLGYAYAGQRQWFSAARLFETASHLGGPYQFEAADQYRMSGQLTDALRMNGFAQTSAKQRAQRLAILFEQKQYARIVAMGEQFAAPDSRYRVAYAHYAIGDYEGARTRTRALLKTDYGQEASALLSAIRREQSR